MHVQPYLTFEGRCEEAANFYRDVLGAEILRAMRFKDSPDQAMCPPQPGSEDKIMHMALRIGESTLSASDGMNGGQANMRGFALSLDLPDIDEAQRLYAALGDGGQVHMPLAKTFFAEAFAMLVDRYGTPWMLLVPPADSPADT